MILPSEQSKVKCCPICKAFDSDCRGRMSGIQPICFGSADAQPGDGANGFICTAKTTHRATGRRATIWYTTDQQAIDRWHANQRKKRERQSGGRIVWQSSNPGSLLGKSPEEREAIFAERRAKAGKPTLAPLSPLDLLGPPGAHRPHGACGCDRCANEVLIDEAEAESLLGFGSMPTLPPTPAPQAPTPAFSRVEPCSEEAPCPVCGSRCGECGVIPSFPMVGRAVLCRKEGRLNDRLHSLFCVGMASDPVFAPAFTNVRVGATPASSMSVWFPADALGKVVGEVKQEQERERMDAFSATLARVFAEGTERAKRDDEILKENYRKWAELPPPPPRFPLAWWNWVNCPNAYPDNLLDAEKLQAEADAFHKAQANAQEPMQRVLAEAKDAIEVLSASKPKKASTCCVTPRWGHDAETGRLFTLHPPCRSKNCPFCWTAKRIGWVAQTATVLSRDIGPKGTPAEGKIESLPWRTGQLWRGRFRLADRAKLVRQIKANAKKAGVPNASQVIRISSSEAFVVAPVPFGPDDDPANPGPAHLVLSEALCALGDVPRYLRDGQHLVRFNGCWKAHKEESHLKMVHVAATVAEVRRIADEMEVPWKGFTPTQSIGKVTLGIPAHRDNGVFDLSDNPARTRAFLQAIGYEDLADPNIGEIRFRPLLPKPQPPGWTPWG